ncbi:DUF5610 domain-containing protein [uncultured Paraglaciecola sp.]|uniref:DUF5610 domain-containing protein n=1 Tax=uncultured Paraglaciecola sp. TaxID=1765024 RepID=UPI00259A2530|nr:DUF5610 domain-containing protein [uncultured Paraglaciecola sp.]
MNISQLKAFLGDKPQHLGSENSLQNQLRDSGLEQAARNQSNLQKLQSDTFSSSSSFGVRIYSNSMSSSLEVNRQKPNFSVPEKDKAEESLFNFEEVTKNVLNFVTGAITNAQNKGVSEEELNSLFDQALSGVLKGVDLAEQDLAGFMNEDIAEGISQSKSLIQQGIEQLRNKVFGNETESSSSEESDVLVSTDISNFKLQQGELYIRTKDGDQVLLTFDDIEQLDISQKEILEKVKDDSAEITPIMPQPTTELESETTEDNLDSLVTEDTVVANVNESEESIVLQQNSVYFQESSLSFSVKGELDEAELEAIADLVANTYELAEEFFNGDIETAFNQALELGFDEQELTGFALQLTKVENTQVIKTYETVSRYDNENTENEPAKAVSPVADYLDKLLNVLDGSRSQFDRSESYENVVNELINRLGSEVATPDLISAINRFNEFNQRLINNLPVGFQPES